MKIKAIAFDLVGVLIKEGDNVSPLASQLERRFTDFDEVFFQKVKSELGLLPKEVEKILSAVMDEVYELRDPKIFSAIPKDIKLAVASNHLSAVVDWLDRVGVKKYFSSIVVSSQIGVAKPDKRFFEILIEEIAEKPADILFIDDHQENIQSAREVGLTAFCFNSQTQNLRSEVLKIL
jgi:HAD superfamily hydrolase (TIGR01509 family)